MRTAILSTTLAAVLAACADPKTAPVEAGKAETRPEAATWEPGALPGPADRELPPAPPLWRMDPALDRSADLLAGVPDDPVRGVPASLRGLRFNALYESNLRATIRFDEGRGVPVLPYVGKAGIALSREDFRRGSRLCLEDLFEYRRASEIMLRGDYRSAEEQAYWYASLRAKEAVFGVGAEEAACERALLEGALLVAHGRWRDVFARSVNRESILEEWEEWVGWGAWEYPEPDREAAARLERWLMCDAGW